MILLKNGLFVDPGTGTEGIRDVAIDDGVIIKIAESIDSSEYDNPMVYDCTNLIIGPGLVDIHVHFRDPGFTHKEDIYTGAKAAIRGGVTSVVLMANTKPVVDNVETLEYVLNKGAETGINVHSCAAVTTALKGEELVDFDTLLKHGAAGFTDDGIPILNENIARAAMVEAAKYDTVLSFHEENPEYIENNGVNKGKASAYFGIGGSDREAEISMVKRDVQLAMETGAKINIQHISTAEAVEIIREAKVKHNAKNIFAEATPHHISLTEDDTITHGTFAKMNPPLRTEADRRAIIDGLCDGTIDFIATDHAPHTNEEKGKHITEAPSGIIGLETSLKVSYNTLVSQEKMSILQLFCKMSYNPAKLYGICAGELAIGRHADIVVFDPNSTAYVNQFVSKSQNSPFENNKITGDVVMTICNGKILYNTLSEQ